MHNQSKGSSLLKLAVIINLKIDFLWINQFIGALLVHPAQLALIAFVTCKLVASMHCFVFFGFSQNRNMGLKNKGNKRKENKQTKKKSNIVNICIGL